MIKNGTPKAKAASWKFIDAEALKLGERKGLETPVVLAVNACLLVFLIPTQVGRGGVS